ncbi:DUF2178 domain-containing protein [Gracilibacillus suaedae]|uniref:DUF2178 domain-containing protein n=1 Tax=Gracilibacillus suaedae TaxID=2820273 RepID=UPI001ABE49E3|nr:DUF2178 domain-containing protein [Gracilibacillus suaedae]
MIKMKMESIFDPLRTWAEESPGNWNILLGSGFVLLVVGMILVFVFMKKMGKGDERTNQIYLKSTLVMLFGVILCDLIFPKEYMWQIFFLFKYSLAFIASGIYLAIQYKRDFLN